MVKSSFIATRSAKTQRTALLPIDISILRFYDGFTADDGEHCWTVGAPLLQDAGTGSAIDCREATGAMLVNRRDCNANLRRSLQPSNRGCHGNDEVRQERADFLRHAQEIK